MEIDINFKFYSDSRGGDPDSASPTLRKYHKILWSKPLPCGKEFELSDIKVGTYLYHESELGEFFLGSDAITNSYKNHKRKQWLTKQVHREVDELFERGSTIGCYIVYPKNRIDGNHTINQARGVSQMIDDRFDLTLECIRRFYLDQISPLYNTFLRYKQFFDLFEDFEGYINFFLLDDLIDKNKNIKFYLPFDDFKNPPIFSDINDYLQYQKEVIDFIGKRNNRIEKNSLLKYSK